MSAILLLTVTALSATVAAVMSAIAWRVAREERKRERTRISALAAEIYASADDLDASQAAARVAQRPIIGIRDEPARRPVAAESAWSSPPPTLFEPAAAEAPAGSRWATIIGVGVFAVATAAALMVSVSTGPRTAPVGPIAAAASEHAGPDAYPLELVALGHERDADQLTVRGLVRNPASGIAVDRLTAVVFVFNQDGGFVTSARAAIAASELGPGRQSTFVVAVPNAAAVSRYRVSFRSGDRLVPHVDKREPGAMARAQ